METPIKVKFKIVGELPLDRDDFSNANLREFAQEFADSLNKKVAEGIEYYRTEKVKSFIMIPELPAVKKTDAYTIETPIIVEE